MPPSCDLLDVPYNQFADISLLTHEAIALFVAHTLKLRKEQTFVLAGSEDLRALLPKLRMHHTGDEAYILYRPYIHSMAIYMRYEAGRVHVYLFDSQNWGFRYYPTRLAVACIQDYYPGAQIVLSDSLLQCQDFNEGCTQYSLYFLEYCMAQGAGIFGDSVDPQAAQCSVPGNDNQVTRATLPDELKATAMSVDPEWYRRFRSSNLRQLDEILTQYRDANGQLNWTQVFETVERLQGVYLPQIESIALTHQPSFQITFARSTLRIHWHNSRDNYLYSNCLLFSAEKYPSKVKDNTLACVFDRTPGISVLRNIDEYCVTLEATSAKSMENALNSILQNKTLLWQSQMRQWGGLQAIILELQQELALHAICQNKSGGFTQRHVQLALRQVLAEQTKVYVPGIEMLAGHTAALSMNALYANDFRYVAFSYQSTPVHQVAIWVILGHEHHEVVVYDSLGSTDIAPELDTNLRSLLCLKENDRVRAAPSFYSRQTDDWSCGVHVWAILAHLAGISNSFPDDLVQAARTLYACYKNQELLDASKESDKIIHQQRTGVLLRAIEQYRHLKGYYLLPNAPHDIFKPLADYLQKVYWGNLDRYPLDTQQYGRAMEASASHFGMSFEELLVVYPHVGHDRAKLILQIAHLRSDLEKMDWSAIFHVLEKAVPHLNNKGLRDTVQLIIQDIISQTESGEMKASELITLVDEMLKDTANVVYDLMPILNRVYHADANVYYAGIRRICGSDLMNEVRFSLVSLLTSTSMTIQANITAADTRKQVEREVALRAQTELVDWYHDRFKALGLKKSLRLHLLEGANLKRADCVLFNAIKTSTFRKLPSSTQQDFIRWLLTLHRPFVERVFLQQATELSTLNVPLFNRFFMNWLNLLIKKNILPKRLKSLLSYNGIPVFKNDWARLYWDLPEPLQSLVLSKPALMALREGFINFEQIQALPIEKVRSLLSDPGVKALRKRLITFEQIRALPLAIIRSLFSEPGIRALGKGLISLEQILSLPTKNVKSLLSEPGVEALRKGLINIAQIKALPAEKVTSVLSFSGIDALRKRLINFEQIKALPIKKLQALLSPSGVAALWQCYITYDQVCRFETKKIQRLLTPSGIYALHSNASQSRLISLKQIRRLPEEKLKSLLSSPGINALQKRLISIKQVHALPANKLQALFTIAGVSALRERLLTIKQVHQLPAIKLQALLNHDSLAAYRARLISLEWIHSMPELKLLYFLNNTGMQALREHLISLDQLEGIPEEIIRLVFSQGFKLAALRDGLISIEQLQTVSEEKIKLSLSYFGVRALRTGSITVDQIHNMSYEKASLLLSERCINLIEDGLLSPEQARTMETEKLDLLLRPNGCRALKKHWILPEQVQRLPLKTLHQLFTDSGLKALQDGQMRIPDRQLRSKNRTLQFFPPVKSASDGEESWVYTKNS